MFFFIPLQTNGVHIHIHTHPCTHTPSLTRGEGPQSLACQTSLHPRPAIKYTWKPSFSRTRPPLPTQNIVSPCAGCLPMLIGVAGLLRSTCDAK